MFQTNSSFHNTLVSALPSFFPTSNYKEKKCPAFYRSEIHRLYIRTQFGLVMRLCLCISPCRQPNLQLPAHMGALLSRKALRKYTGKSVAFFHLEETLSSPCVVFSKWPWEISKDKLTFLNKALSVFWYGSQHYFKWCEQRLYRPPVTALHFQEFPLFACSYSQCRASVLCYYVKSMYVYSSLLLLLSLNVIHSTYALITCVILFTFALLQSVPFRQPFLSIYFTTEWTSGSP